VYNKWANLSISNQRKRLPIFNYRNHILYLLEHHQTLIIVGETGSGKSTQVPQYLMESGWLFDSKIVVTQPRRIAAINLASRVAEECGSILGDEVGYAIRFEECCDHKTTKIKYVTEGILLREMMSDPLLKKYTCVMIDEAHERNINTDLCVGLLKKIQRKRKDLRVIISSATACAEKFEAFFTTKDNKPALLSVEGRNYPIEVFYSKHPVSDYLKATFDTVMQIHFSNEEGDILAFLTGQDEVEKVVQMLIDHLRKLQSEGNKRHLKVLPLYSTLPPQEQMKVFEKNNRRTRRVIVSTNIAETSLTIDNVNFIVDCGFVKMKVYNPKTAVESLVVCEASKASLEQRAGRAGRCRNGKVFRLFPESCVEALSEFTVPEMQRSNLVGVILQLKALGVDNVLRFSFLSPPPAQCMVRALELLYAFGAVDPDGALTRDVGRKMAEFPLSPMFVKLLLDSEKFGCSEEVVSIAALLQVRQVFAVPKGSERMKARIEQRKFAVAEGDHVSLLNVYEAFVGEGGGSKGWCGSRYLNYKGLKRAGRIRQQLVKYLSRFDIKPRSCDGDIEAVQKCIASAFFANAARLHGDGTYRGLHNTEVKLAIHPTSVLSTESPPKWIVFNEVIETSKLFARDITVIKPEWLTELAPHFYHENFADTSVKRAKF